MYLFNLFGISRLFALYRSQSLLQFVIPFVLPFFNIPQHKGFLKKLLAKVNTLCGSLFGYVAFITSNVTVSDNYLWYVLCQLLHQLFVFVSNLDFKKQWLRVCFNSAVSDISFSHISVHICTINYCFFSSYFKMYMSIFSFTK